MRDFTKFDPEEGDSEEVLTKKLADKAARLDFFDFYVDKMLPTCAGTKMWHSGIRHFEAVSASKLPDASERISASTEGLCAVLYKNGRKKWIAMHKWYQDNPGAKKEPPRWNKKKPGELTEFMTLYSDPYGGQNKLGGWTKEGRKLHVRLSKSVLEARKKKECVEVEMACVARLFAQNKAHYDNKNASKKRKAEEIADESEDDPGDLEWVV